MTAVDVRLEKGCLTMPWCYRVIFISSLCVYGLSIATAAPINTTYYDGGNVSATVDISDISTLPYTQVVSAATQGPTEQHSSTKTSPSDGISSASTSQGGKWAVTTSTHDNLTAVMKTQTNGVNSETTLKQNESSTISVTQVFTDSSLRNEDATTAATTRVTDVSKQQGSVSVANTTQAVDISTNTDNTSSNSNDSTVVLHTKTKGPTASTTVDMSAVTTKQTETSGNQVNNTNQVEVTTDPPPKGFTIVKREVNITVQSTTTQPITKGAETTSILQRSSVTVSTPNVAVLNSSTSTGTTTPADMTPNTTTEMLTFDVVDVTSTLPTASSTNPITNGVSQAPNATDMDTSGDDVTKFLSYQSTGNSDVASVDNSTGDNATDTMGGSGVVDISTYVPPVNYTEVPTTPSPRVDPTSQTSTGDSVRTTQLGDTPSTSVPPSTPDRIPSSTRRPTSSGTTSGKGNDKPETRSDRESLTTILLVLCASLLVLLFAFCVFTYVKFRKKSRSIRKRLTFKDDAIYDNPIYHGRWEVPKTGEPATASCPRSLPMLITALPDEVVRLSKNEDMGFREQFMMLNKLSPSHARQTATTDMNTHRNRYRDILPFDHNRVKLALDGDKSDYINASYVPGVRSETEYIATQGPLERTAPDHWRMIWEHNIRTIAMLTTCEEGDLIFKAKCYQYWSNKENDTVNYGGIYVTLVSTARLCRDNYKLKILNIRKGKDTEPRKVYLFQYIKWPDRRNPEDAEAFLEYREHVKREIPNGGEPSPLLVHCSAGVGRTGTFIAIDTLLQHMEERESIDIYGLVLRLRKYRVLLVQNADQYKFVHSCLLMILDKRKKAEVDEGQRKAGSEGPYPYENMVMSQRALVGELGGMVYGDEDTDAPKQQALQSFLRKTKTNVHSESDTDEPPNRKSEEMPSPTKSDGSPRPRSEPEQNRSVIETPKSKPYSGSKKGDSERALAKELGGMILGGVEKSASPGKSAAIKAFLRNKATDMESGNINGTSSEENHHQREPLVNDNQSQEDDIKQTTSL